MKNLVNFLSLLSLFYLNSFGNLGRAAQEDSSRSKQENAAVVLKPKIRITELEQANKLQLSKILPYLENMLLTKNSVFDVKQVRIKRKCFRSAVEGVGVVEEVGVPVGIKHGSYVVGFQDRQIQLAGTNDLVFVAGIAEDLYYFYSLVKPVVSYYHPDTKKYLGTQMQIIGTAKLLKRSKLSLLQIISAKEPIKAGTLILPSKSLNLPNELEPTFAKQKLKGYILSISPSLYSAGTNQVVVISLGKEDGLKVGNLLKVQTNNLILEDPYNDYKCYEVTELPSKGEVFLYDVFEHLSVGIILRSSGEIQFLDQVIT